MGEDRDRHNPWRLYQAWKGSNKFLCGGRLVFGPDVASMFVSVLLIAGPAIGFCIRVYFKIVNKDTQHPDLWSPVFIVGCLITVIDVTFLLLTSSRDPGIVTRNSRPPESEEAFEITTPSMEWVNGRTPHLKLPRTKDVLVNGHAVKVKYCDTCLLYRPPRVSHCSICNNCVQRFDHHCPWVGQCIGIRNYRFFFMFVSTSTFLCIYVLTFSWIIMLDGQKNVLKAMSHDIVSILLIAYCFIVVWFVGGLTVFHSYLICTNQTTYENFRYRYDMKENPYNRGILRNIAETFFSKMPPAIHFRQFVEEDEQFVSPPAMPYLADDLGNSKDKIDIEMGAKFTEERSYSLPEILRNLDYNDDSSTEGEERISFDPLLPGGLDAKDSLQTLVAEDEFRVVVEGSNTRDGVEHSAPNARISTEESVVLDGEGEHEKSLSAVEGVKEYEETSSIGDETGLTMQRSHDGDVH